MSDTTFVQEVTRGDLPVRVSLTMDLDELLALVDVATLAVDAAVLIPDTCEVTASNAKTIYTWAIRTAAALDAVASRGKE